MIDTKKAIDDSKRSQYFGRTKLTQSMKLSRRVEKFLAKITPSFKEYRRNKIDRTLEYMWQVGDRVKTFHGNGTVISNYKAIDSDGMGGFIQTDVRYDTAPPEATSYPDVGHYNQIFLERE